MSNYLRALGDVLMVLAVMAGMVGSVLAVVVLGIGAAALTGSDTIGALTVFTIVILLAAALVERVDYR